MPIIKNAILLPIQRLIGIAPAPTETVVDTSSVSLTMPILPDMARRSLSSQPTGGFFIGVLENVHSAADDENSTIDPYNPGPDVFAPYPALVDPGFDVWILKVGGERIAGAGTLDVGLLSLVNLIHTLGWGRDDAQDPVPLVPNVTLARFDAIDEVVGAAIEPFITEQGETAVDVSMRIPRGSRLRFHSTAGTASATFNMWFIVGLFPGGMGQDVVA